MCINASIKRAKHGRTTTCKKYILTPKCANGAQSVTLFSAMITGRAALIFPRTLATISLETPQVPKNAALKGVTKCMISSSTRLCFVLSFSAGYRVTVSKSMCLRSTIFRSPLSASYVSVISATSGNLTLDLHILVANLFILGSQIKMTGTSTSTVISVPCLSRLHNVLARLPSWSWKHL